MFKSLIKRLERSNTKLKIKQLELSTHKNELARDKDLQTMMNLWNTFQVRKVKSYDNFFNICIYASLVGRDILYLTDSFVKTLIKRERNILGRLLSMTLIEFLDDINGLLGKDLRIELQKSGFSTHLDELRGVGKKFSTLKKEHQSELRRIRNNAAAHKTKNAQHLFELNNELEFDQIFDLSADVSRINTELTRLTTKILYSIIDQQNIELEDLKAETVKIELEIEELKRRKSEEK